MTYIADIGYVGCNKQQRVLQPNKDIESIGILSLTQVDKPGLGRYLHTAAGVLLRNAQCNERTTLLRKEQKSVPEHWKLPVTARPQVQVTC